MLSAEMTAELEYFFAMLLYGVLASVCYHLLLLLRALIRHSVTFVDAEDILFLMAAGVGFFLVAYEKNFGILRWYAFAGAGAGCFVYAKLLVLPLETVRKWLLQINRKTFTIKKKSNSKGKVLLDEGSSPEY